MIPGVSTSETIGRPKASQSCRKRAALSAPSLVIAPARCIGLLAIDAERPALDPRQRGHHLGREALAQEGRPSPRRRASRSTRRDVVGAPRGARARRRAARPGRAPSQSATGALEVGEQPLRDRDRLGLVGDHDVDDAVRRLHRRSARSRRARPCRGRRPRSSPARPSRARCSRWRRSGRSSRRAPRCRRSSGRRRSRSAAPGPRAAPRARRRGCRAPRRPGSRCRRAARRRPRRRRRSAAACARSARRAGPSCGGRARPACRRAPCSRRRARRRRPRSPNRSPLTRAVPRDQAVGGRARDQLVELAARRAGRRSRSAPYSTKVPGSTRSSTFSRAVRPPRGVAALDRLGPRLVLGQRAGARAPRRGRRGRRPLAPAKTRIRLSEWA